jgi:hypothetical protein
MRVLQKLGGPGVHLSDAAFTADSSNLLITGAAGYPIELSAMALGSVPSGTYLGNLHDELLVVDNANIFDNLDIVDRGVPIRFATDGVHVGGLAPSFVPDLTLTLEAGVVIRFAKFSSGPTMVTFGDVGQTQDKNAAFVVKGTASKPVTLTSGEDVPAPGDWAGIWLVTSNRSQMDHLTISYAGGDAAVGPRNCGPPGVRHTAALLVGDGTDLQYIPPGVLITNSTFSDNAGNFAIDSVWQAPTFSPILTATNQFVRSGAVCTQSKNLIPGGCTVGGGRPVRLSGAIATGTGLVSHARTRKASTALALHRGGDRNPTHVRPRCPRRRIARGYPLPMLACAAQSAGADRRLSCGAGLAPQHRI